MNFTQAIVRLPAANFAAGITTVDLGQPNYQLALQQHADYCEALLTCGVAVRVLEADTAFPDSTFVEDTAVLTPRGAVLTRPGAASRLREVESIGKVLSTYYPTLHRITEPGKLDGGDVCQVDDHFFIGLSHRTNDEGAAQLTWFLQSFGYTTSLIDLRSLSNILHLKSGLAYLGEGLLVLAATLADEPEFQSFRRLRVDFGSDYAANCIRVNDHVLIAAGFPAFDKELEDFGYRTIELQMSEFQKMDGGLSCLSLRF